MIRFAVSAVVLLAFASGLSGCNQTKGVEDGPEMVMADPKVYTPAEKASILATFPAPFNTADLDDGEKQFGKCRACHTITPEGMNMTGPHLYGVFGRHAATAKSYTYSDAMTKHDVVWDFNTLDVYLKAPQQVVKGTKMGFMGIESDTQRRNLIAYLALETQAHEAKAASVSAESK